jgi:hypothetical protein
MTSKGDKDMRRKRERKTRSGRKGVKWKSLVSTTDEYGMSRQAVLKNWQIDGGQYAE